MVPPDEAVKLLPEVMAELAAVKAENAWLKHQLFGPGKSEKLDRLQTALPLAETPAKAAEPKVETITYERIAVPKEKRPVPAETFKNVPVKETVVIASTDLKLIFFCRFESHGSSGGFSS